MPVDEMTEDEMTIEVKTVDEQPSCQVFKNFAGKCR